MILTTLARRVQTGHATHRHVVLQTGIVTFIGKYSTSSGTRLGRFKIFSCSRRMKFCVRSVSSRLLGDVGDVVECDLDARGDNLKKKNICLLE